MGGIIGSVVLGVIAILCFWISCRQFQQKGFLWNNASVLASEREPEITDKKPHYMQSGIVFLLLGILFFIIATDCILRTSWLFYCEVAIVAGVMIYAVVSSVKIEKNTK